ncbi:MAG TPA: GNAT family N-acetyltransferase [Acidimicrobiales bacterium]
MTSASAAPPRVLRPATAGDVEAIATLWHEGWQEAHRGHVPEALSRQRTLAALSRRVAEDLAAIRVVPGAEGPAGFVTVHGDEVEQLYVAPEARGTGVAARLLDHAETTIAERHDGAWLAVVAANTRARGFYARRGWVDAGPGDYGARTAAGTVTVAVRRYEKQVRP